MPYHSLVLYTHVQLPLTITFGVSYGLVLCPCPSLPILRFCCTLRIAGLNTHLLFALPLVTIRSFWCLAGYPLPAHLQYGYRPRIAPIRFHIHRCHLVTFTVTVCIVPSGRDWPHDPPHTFTALPLTLPFNGFRLPFGWTYSTVCWFAFVHTLRLRYRALRLHLLWVVPFTDIPLNGYSAFPRVPLPTWLPVRTTRPRIATRHTDTFRYWVGAPDTT